MSNAIQHALVFVAAAAAAWAAWRNLRGRPLFRRSKPATPSESCSSCHSAADHHRH